MDQAAKEQTLRLLLEEKGMSEQVLGWGPQSGGGGGSWSWSEAGQDDAAAAGWCWWSRRGSGLSG
jgi:hypothetical protein